MSINFQLTTAGAAAVLNAQNNGLDLELTHVQLGSGKYIPTGDEVNLLDPKATVAIAGGGRINETTIRINAIFTGPDSFYVYEIGLWEGDPMDPASTLIAVAAQTTPSFCSKIADVDLLFNHTLAIDDAPEVTVLADAGQSYVYAALDTHRDDPGAHPQYLLAEDGVDAYTKAESDNMLANKANVDGSNLPDPTQTSSSTAIATTGWVKGQFGGEIVSNTEDWNNHTLPGVGNVMMRGTNPNGCGPNDAFHVLNFESGTAKDGTGGITQIAFPLLATSSTTSVYYRGRYSTWRDWMELISSANIGNFAAKKDGSNADSPWSLAIRIDDTRNVETYGSDALRAVRWDFKTTSLLGITGKGTYAPVQTIAPWVDGGGGKAKQIAYLDTGEIAMRQSVVQDYAGGWGDWEYFWSASNMKQTWAGPVRHLAAGILIETDLDATNGGDIWILEIQGINGAGGGQPYTVVAQGLYATTFLKGFSTGTPLQQLKVYNIDGKLTFWFVPQAGVNNWFLASVRKLHGGDVHNKITAMSAAAEPTTGVTTSNVIPIEHHGSNGVGNRTVSTAIPSGGEDGDIWYQVAP